MTLVRPVPTARATNQLWQGKTPDSQIPDKVRWRILNRQRDASGQPVCPDCGKVIYPGEGVEYDHAVPLIDGGSHSEANLRAVHRRCHKMKTAREAHARAEERAQGMKVYGVKAKPKYRWPRRPMSGWPSNSRDINDEGTSHV